MNASPHGRCSRRRLIGPAPAAMLLLYAIHGTAGEVPDHPAARHGGVVVARDGYVLELVASAKALSLFVSDIAGEPVDTAFADGTLSIFGEVGKPTIVTLHPAGGNRLIAEPDLDASARYRVVANLRLYGRAPVRVTLGEIEAVDSFKASQSR